MMKLNLFVSMMLLSLFTKAQLTLTPENITIDKKIIKDETYTMNWYIVKDTIKREFGKVTTQIVNNKQTILVITKVALKGAKNLWVDSTIVSSNNFKPIYHSSYNSQRDMAINFEKVVKGYYKDKMQNSMININDTVNASYFDSNFYTTLLRWLPLSDNYTSTLKIYDYNPNKKGLMNAYVKEVKSSIFKLNPSNETQVWEVNASDEIGGAQNSNVYYYIDKKTRVLYKQVIDFGARKMVMELER